MSAPRTFAVVDAAYVAELESRVAALEARGSSSPTHYSQADGHRPAWLPTRVLFLRAWRERRKAGDEGAIRAGKVRLLTAAAAARWLEAHRDRPRDDGKAAPTTLDADLDAALGIRTRVGAVR